jgi:diacylglycerol kinase family enzyme
MPRRVQEWGGMPSMMAIVNRNSGGGADPDALLERMLDPFRRAGWDTSGEACAGPGLGGAFDRALELKPDRLIVAGGDGTIRSAALVAMGTGSALGIVSLGTMNLLAKDLHLPLDPAEAASVMAELPVAPMDVGEINGRIFLHSALLGVLPQIGAERERARSEGGGGAYWRALWNAATAVARARVMSAVVSSGARASALRTYAIIVSNNRLFGYPDAPYRRVRLDAGELGVYVSRHRTRLGLVKMLAWIGLGWWRFDRDIVERVLPEATIEARGPVEVLLDGEAEWLESPLRCRVMPGALRVLVRPTAAGAAEGGAR